VGHGINEPRGAKSEDKANEDRGVENQDLNRISFSFVY
jgi:hypothetical protein